MKADLQRALEGITDLNQRAAIEKALQDQQETAKPAEMTPVEDELGKGASEEERSTSTHQEKTNAVANNQGADQASKERTADILGSPEGETDAVTQDQGANQATKERTTDILGPAELAKIVVSSILGYKENGVFIKACPRAFCKCL